ncbi:hypothetical protein BDQ17DRAFT_1423565 [Cyathus striatus]|nr:hypothetical protein BDQ17DRAFT_1423565 [Cyathus striatus]
MPDGTPRSQSTPTFNTLEREAAFRNPPKDRASYSILNEFVAPHIESFNSIFDDSGLPSGDGDGKGLLSLALKEIGERVVFDKNIRDSADSGWGNRMRIWIEQVTIARPMVPEKDKTARERRVFPSEARERLTSYKGRMMVKLCWTDISGQKHDTMKDCGLVPIMVRVRQISSS